MSATAAQTLDISLGPQHPSTHGVFRMNVTLDETGKGQIKSGQMLMADVEPGTHRLHAAMAKGIMANAGAMEVTVAAGEVAVIDAMFEMSALKGDAKLTRLDGAKARENVNATKLILWEVAAG